MGGGVMSKVGMCCDCSRRYTEQGSKSCRKQDLLKKRLVCEFLLILFVYFRVSRENRKITLVDPQKPYLSWLVISEKTARALFCLFLPPFFFFLAYQISDIGTTGIFSGFMKRLFYHVMNTFIHICKYCWRHWQFGEKNDLTGLGKYCSQTLKSKKIKSNKSIFCIS